MKDKLEWSDIELLEYVKKAEAICLPDMDEYEYRANITIVPVSDEEARFPKTMTFGEYLFWSEALEVFKERYNQKQIQLSYEKYAKDKTIQKYISELELDKDKFWLLFLFLYDYCVSMFMEGKTMKLNPYEQIRQLVEIINEHADNMTLNIKASKTKAIIDDPHALRFMANAIVKCVEEADEETIKYLSRRMEAENNIALKDSPIIAYFAKQMLRFFNSQPQVRAKRKKGAKHSLKETDLISQLIYFTRLSRNEELLLSNNDIIKAFLRQYKDYKYPKNVSEIYPETIF